MTVKDYIYDVIRNHCSNYHIWISKPDVERIYDNVINNQVYAFQIIYNDCQVHTVGSRVIRYIFKEHKNLNHKLLVYEEDREMWSYDGGKRFQWSGAETLIFDLSFIRSQKLDELGV